MQADCSCPSHAASFLAGCITTKRILSGGEQATWALADRIKLHIGQKELYDMVHNRADIYSAEQQYNNLCEIRRSQVDRLIEDRQQHNPQIYWSCVYAKQTSSMCIILMGTPVQTGGYPRTPMGDLVDLRPGAPLYPFETGQRPAEYAALQGRHSASEQYPDQELDPGRVVAPASVYYTPNARPKYRIDPGQLPVHEK